MKNLFASLFLLFACSYASAEELTPHNLIGQYGVSARVGFQTVYMNFKVLSTKEFEVQRVFKNGRVDQTCNGTYNLNPKMFWLMGKLAPGKFFKGVFTCPDDRSREVDFNIDFTNKTTDDLTRGTEVTVTSSLAAGMKVRAYVKRK